MAYDRTRSAPQRRPGQHRDPITRAFLGVLQALIWDFHNSRSGCCFPSYENHRRQGRVRAEHRRRGAEGAGVGRCADLAEPHRADPGARARPVRPVGEPLARHPHVQCLRVPRPSAGARRHADFQVRKSSGKPESKFSMPVLVAARDPDSALILVRASSAPTRQRDRRKIALEGSGGPNPEGCDSAHDLS
jgi:hypothetical protein